MMRTLSAIAFAFLVHPLPAVSQARQARTAAECTARPCTIVSSTLAPVVTFEEAFIVQQELTLQATAAAPIQLVNIAKDPQGGFFMGSVAGGESTARRYGEDGRLVWSVPSLAIHKGFDWLDLIARLSPTQLLMSGGRGEDGLRGYVVWNEERRALEGVRMLAAIKGAIHSVRQMSDGSLLLSADVAEEGNYALHVVDPVGGRPNRSFFSPPVTPLTRGAVQSGYGSISSAFRGDTIASVFAFSDTIYIHTLGGVMVEKIQLPTAYFALPTSASEPNRSSTGMWRSGVGEVGGISWLEDGRFVIEYQRAVGPGQRRQRCFLIVARNGDGVMDVHGWDSHIQTVDSRGTFYFVDPKTESRAPLLAARLRAR